jgi:hypothetical protein
MNQELFNQVLALLVGGVFGVVSKYWYDYKGMVHKELWKERYEVYKKMFFYTGILPQYPQKTEVTYEELFKRSEEMSVWFFKEGGLLISTKTRNKYFKVQKNIQAILENKTTEARNKKITDEYEIIRQLFSQLRKVMTDDLMSRRRL